MIEALIALDHQIFILINQAWTHPFLTDFFALITNLNKQSFFKFMFLPTLLILGFWHYRFSFLKWLLALGISVGLADAFTYRVVKAIGKRPRPVQVQGLKVDLKLPKSPSDYSFPSNHAANNFAGAVILSYLFPAASPFVYLFAFLVAYSRPYLGVHFPLDVLFGALLGFCISRILLKQIFLRFRWWEFQR